MIKPLFDSRGYCLSDMPDNAAEKSIHFYTNRGDAIGGIAPVFL